MAFHALIGYVPNKTTVFSAAMITASLSTSMDYTPAPEKCKDNLSGLLPFVAG
jgi:hypothetical protein